VWCLFIPILAAQDADETETTVYETDTPEITAQEAAAREKTAEEAADWETAVREALEREEAVREAVLRDAADWEEAKRDAAARREAERENAAAEKAAWEKAARDAVDFWHGRPPYLFFSLGGIYYPGIDQERTPASKITGWVGGLPIKDPWPGIRLGIGTELPLGPGSIVAGLETGWNGTGLTGYYRPSDNANFFPAALRAGYQLYPSDFISWWPKSLAVRPEVLGGGMLFLAGGQSAFVTFVGARLQAEYLLGTAGPRLLWSVYAGGGMDLFLQDQGIVTLPAVEAGVRLRVPFPGTRLGNAWAELRRLEKERKERERREPLEQEQLENERLERERRRREEAEAARQERERVERERDEWREEQQRREAAKAKIREAMGERPVWVTLEDGERGVVLTKYTAYLPGEVLLADFTAYFDGEVADMDPETRAKMDKAAEELRRTAEILRGVPGLRIAVAGHAAAWSDERGSWELSRERAEGVAKALRFYGVDLERVVWFGDTRRVAPNGTPEGRALNRRVELILLNAQDYLQ
jgi:outer membrane protein OmpA-like peptidoglycan-associated protein